MKLLAVICEYNPFHNGHAYQLERQKKELGCDGVVCLMSGSFVQRGEPAVFDKWARSEMALRAGCDLVIELPVLYSLQSAEGFAGGGIALLSSLGIRGYLGFGSESGDVDLLVQSAKIMSGVGFSKEIKARLNDGMSYPKACSEAIANFSSIVLSPNDILGIEYIKAIKKFSADLLPAALKRIGNAHDGEEPCDCYFSATGIRNALRNHEDIREFVPEETFQIMHREISAGRGPVFPESVASLYCYAVSKESREVLTNIIGISEGLEKRLIDSAAKYRLFSDIVQEAKTKRYPQTRIQRAMINVLLGITKQDEKINPAYARVLGIGEKGPEILRHLQDKTHIPIITKVADAKLTTNDGKRLFSLDVSATDLYSLLYPVQSAGKNNMDFYRSPVVLR